MTTRARWIIGGLGLAAATLVAVAWWQRSRGLEVEMLAARTGVFEELLVEDGRTRVRWHEDLTAPVGGTWVPAGLEAGDTVALGALLGTLRAAPQDPATTSQSQARVGVAQAALREARAALAAAALQEDEARRARGRTERLSTSGGVSEEQQEVARATHEGAERNLEAARARVAAAEYELAAARAFLPGGAGRPVELRAPSAGVILRVDEAHERVVPPGTPLLQLGGLGEPEVVARVLSADAPRVRVGAPLYAIVGTDTLRGHVTRVEPSAQTVRSALGVEEQRVPVIGDVHSGPLSVGHDFQVDVRIVLRRIDAATIIPTGALRRDGTAWTVFAVGEDGRARLKPVTVVAHGAEESAVEGLATGARVVVYPPDALQDGGRVR